MNRTSVVIYALLVVLLGALILAPSDKPNDSSSLPKIPLTYSKPVFTTSITVVCPMSLFFDIRADHSPEKVIDMFSSIFTRSEKAKALGCLELREGILVSANPFADEFVSVQIPGDSSSKWFTLAGELTNDVPGQTGPERAELAEPHIAHATGEPVAVPTTPSAGHTLVNMPSRTPIPKGEGVAASNSLGYGAIICPDEDHLAALSDFTLDTSRKPTTQNEWDEYRRLGCSYVPPGTEMVSEGANEQGSLAIVSTMLLDGTAIHGVTFPNMFMPKPTQGEASLDK